MLDLTTCHTRLAEADHGILATVDAGGRPHAVPVCFVVVEDHVVVPVDTVKPKSTTALRRSSNIDETRRAALLVERWDHDDWSKLWWARADLLATDLDDQAHNQAADALRSRYRQYRDTAFAALVTLRIEHLSGWEAGR